MRSCRTALVALLVTFGSSNLAAQESASRWQWIVQPYFMASHMSGSTGIGPILAEVDAGPSDIFSKLQFGIMLNVEARKNLWAVALDAIYMDLEEETEVGTLTVGAKQSAIELAVFRRIGKSFEVLAGGRYNGLKASIEGDAVNQSLDQSWFDPIVGLRLSTPEEKKWSFSLRGDVGGFGLGSNLTVQILPILGYRISRTVGLAIGYRLIDADYENEDDNFVYDMTTFGPDLRVKLYF